MHDGGNARFSLTKYILIWKEEAQNPDPPSSLISGEFIFAARVNHFWSESQKSERSLYMEWMNGLSVFSRVFGSELSCGPLHTGKLMSLLVHCHGNMPVELKSCDNPVHGQSADVHALTCLFFMTEKPHGTWFKEGEKKALWECGFYGSATALPSCQPLAHWAKACKGTTEWTDSSLEAWQQPSGSDSWQTLTAPLLLPSSSLNFFFFVSWAGEIWQIFPSTAAATYFSRFICNHRLSPSASSKVFFGFFFSSGELMWEVAWQTQMKKQHSVLSYTPPTLPSEAAEFEFRREEEKKILWNGAVVFFSHHEVSGAGSVPLNTHRKVR